MVSEYFFLPKKRYAPNDKEIYIIPEKAIECTETLLKNNPRQRYPTEKLVYWAGKQNNNVITVSAVIAPKINTRPQGVSTSYLSNFTFVRALSELGLIQVAQVHTHPGDWVDHSLGDDEWAAFRVEGLLSIVVPKYAQRGMMPMKMCGVHRYHNGQFIRLSDRYVERHFDVREGLDCHMEDLRDG